MLEIRVLAARCAGGAARQLCLPSYEQQELSKALLSEPWLSELSELSELSDSYRAAIGLLSDLAIRCYRSRIVRHNVALLSDAIGRYRTAIGVSEYRKLEIAIRGTVAT